MNIKLKNDIPVCQRARRLSCSEKLQVNNQIDDWLRQDSPLVSMEIPLRTAYGQNGRCGMQPKPSSLRAQAHQSKSRTETEKSRLLRKNLELEQGKEKRTREVREQALPSEKSSSILSVKTYLPFN
ncbi:hypothetical protein TNCV_4411801 [Trichonephila clavipes]|nr:hypothetical protein TNCV_4411801 [Trichonephila clavipes]